MSTIASDHKQQWTGGFVPPGKYPEDDFRNENNASSRLLRRYRLGLGLWVCSIVMLFVGLSSAYVVRRGIPTYDPASRTYSTEWEKLHLPIALLLANTLLLIAASATIEVARRAARTTKVATFPRKDETRLQIWTFLSLVLLTGFIVGQAVAWQELRTRGEFLASGARSAFFYVLTGAHAAHILVGLLFLLGIAALGRIQQSPSRRYLATDLTAWYLHSMTVLWIYLLAFLFIA